jgi:hypothetical protein
VDAAGNVYFTSDGFQYVRAINMQSTTQTILGVSIPAGCIAAVAGTPGTAGYTGDTGAATAATLNAPAGLAIDSSGNLYIADTHNSAIRKVSTAGIITTFIGGSAGHSGDGGAYTAAQINEPIAICFDANENLYVFCENTPGVNLVVSAVSSVAASVGGNAVYTGTATAGGIPLTDLIGRPVTVAGLAGANNGLFTLVAVGTGNFTLNNPTSSVQTGASGTLTPTDVIPTVRVANLSGSTQVCCGISVPAGDIASVAGLHFNGFSGDGGSAVLAQLNTSIPAMVADASGNLYINDLNNRRIRIVNTSGIINTYAGTGTNGNTGNGGAAASAEISIAGGICFVA